MKRLTLADLASATIEAAALGLFLLALYGYLPAIRAALRGLA